MSEHVEQSLLFQWADVARGRYPELALLFAIPNFAGRLGKLTAIHGARLKREGRKRGVPDICLPVARCGWNALYIELKAPKGRTTKEQDEWIAELRQANNCAVVAVGWERAREVIEDYLTRDQRMRKAEDAALATALAEREAAREPKHGR